MMGIRELLYQAEQAVAEKQYDQAIELYQQCFQLSPDDYQLAQNLILLLVKNNELTKAHDFLQAVIAKNPNVAALHKQLGNVLKSLGEYNSAKDSIKKALQLDADDASAYNNLGLIYYAENNLTAAEACYKKALAIDSAYLTAMYNLALCYKAQNKLTDAVACLMSLTSVSPNHLQANFLLGKLLLEQGLAAEANKYLYKIASLFPDDVDVLQNIAVALFETGFYSEAKPYCLTIVDLQPDHYVMLFNLGVIAEKEQKKSLAFKYYQQALKIKPDYFSALNNLGVLYLAVGEFAQAKQTFEKALALQPGNQAIQYTLSALSGDQSYQVSPAEYISQLFDQYADHFDAHLLTSLEYKVPELLYAVVKPLLIDKSEVFSVLDLGCGTGLAGEVFQSLATQLVGVDLSMKMLEQAKQKNIYDDLVNEEIIGYLQKCKNKFDLIVGADVLVYFGDLTELFKAVQQCLKPKGLFVFSIELTSENNYVLGKNGRFAHSENYLRELAKLAELEFISSKSAVTRYQYGEPVAGQIIVLQLKPQL